MKKAAFLFSPVGIEKRRLCGSLFFFISDNVLHDFAKICRKGKDEIFQYVGVCVHRFGFLGKAQAHKPVKQLDDFEQLFPVGGVFMVTNTSVSRFTVFMSSPVVTHTISANGCVIAPATRFILSLLISPNTLV